MNCTHFDSCNAPLCPLDPTMNSRVYLDSEPVCLFMLEAVKPLGRINLMGVIGGRGADLVAEGVETAFLAYGPIRKRLKRASRTPSRIRG